MVRKGSPVRVRQRACLLASAWARGCFGSLDQLQVNLIASWTPRSSIAFLQSAAALSHSSLVTMQVAVTPDPLWSPSYLAHLSEDSGKIGEMSYVFPPEPTHPPSATAMLAAASSPRGFGAFRSTCPIGSRVLTADAPSLPLPCTMHTSVCLLRHTHTPSLLPLPDLRHHRVDQLRRVRSAC